MTYSELIAAVKDANCAAFRYQQAGRHPFRDRITVYHDGRILFERFCYGESAGLVFTMWAQGAGEDGAIAWDYAACPNSHKTEAPARFTGGTQEALLLDDKAEPWERQACLKSDAANGYSAISRLKARLFGKK